MVGRRRVLAVQPALVASQHPAVLLLGGPSAEKVNLYLPKLPDGTVIWTSPSGTTYVTTPGSALWFPSLCNPTAELDPVPRVGGSCEDPAAMMPKRRRTRVQNRALRVADERRQNRQDREVQISKNRWQRALLMASDEPPPF